MLHTSANTMNYLVNLPFRVTSCQLFSEITSGPGNTGNRKVFTHHHGRFPMKGMVDWGREIGIDESDLVQKLQIFL